MSLSLGEFHFVPSHATIYFNQNARSTLTRDGMLRDLINLSNQLKIRELVMLKDKNNKDIIEGILKEIKNDNWTGPRIYVISDVKRIVDKDEKRIILNDFHLLPTSGHAGINRMVNNIKKYYYWSGMYKDVQKFVKRCDSCQKMKHTNHYIKEPMVITSTANFAFQKVYLDLVGPLPTDINGYSYILTLQCELTKFIEAYPLKSKDSLTVAKSFVNNFILRYGIPSEIATDRGTEFISSTMAEIAKILKINQLQSTAYHHESIGALENSHKVLGAYLRTQTSDNNTAWSE